MTQPLAPGATQVGDAAFAPGHDAVLMPVGGMTCAACTGAVETAVSKIAGVRFAAASLAGRSLRIEIASEADRDGVIAAAQAAIDRMGYASEAPEEGGDEASRILARSRDEEREAKALLQKSVAAILAGAFMMALAPLAMDRAHMMHADFMHRALGAAWQKWLPAAFLLPAVAYRVVLWGVAFFAFGALARAPFARAFRAARSFHATMDTLVVTSAIACVLLSAATGDSYLDGAVMVFGFTGFGKALELRAKRATGAAFVALAELAVPEVRIRKEDGEIAVLERALLRRGDCLVLPPGARIAADAVVTSGTSAIDEVSLTGEPLPRRVAVGDRLLQGALNGDGPLEATVTAAGRDGTLGRLLRALEEASTEKASGFAWVDAIAARFVPALMVTALLVGAAWIFAGYGVAYAARVVASMVAVACPCAVGLAVPVAAQAATSLAARKGIFVRGARALALLGEVRHVVFDKTGTLTVGSPTLTKASWVGEATDAVREAVVALESKSEHVLAKALVTGMRAGRTVRNRPAKDVVIAFGQGIEGTVDGVRYRIGVPEFALDGASEGAESVVVAHQTDGRWAKLAGFDFEDKMRHEAPAVVAALRQEGWNMHLFSGDRTPAVSELAKALGIEDSRGGMLPDDKRRGVLALRETGRVAMVGDGLNDAPALAEADLSLAPGNAVAASLAVADVVFLQNDLARFPELLQLGRAFRRTVHRGLFWAFAYNVIALPVASGVFERSFGVGFTPATAGLAMATSSFLVVVSSLRVV